MTTQLPSIFLMVLVASVFATRAEAPTTLKDAFQGSFVIGAAVNAAQFTGQDARGED